MEPIFQHTSHSCSCSCMLLLPSDFQHLKPKWPLWPSDLVFATCRQLICYILMYIFTSLIFCSFIIKSLSLSALLFKFDYMYLYMCAYVVLNDYHNHNTGDGALPIPAPLQMEKLPPMITFEGFIHPLGA